MIYSVYVCKCGYRMFNLTQKREATRPAIKALRRAAKENHCHFHVGLTKCPSCCQEIKAAETPITIMGPADAQGTAQAAKATFDLLHQG